MFLVANSYPENSLEFLEVFETAARMYPEDEVAVVKVRGGVPFPEMPV